MQIIELDRILASIDRNEIVGALESGFRSYSAGEVQLSPVGYLDLGGGGDCHIKAALADAEPYFVAKFVNGVPANRARGLAVQDGVVILSNAETGAIEAILHDRGELTELRTALAGVAAARLIAKPNSRVLGIVGTGGQALRQAEAVADALGIARADVLIAGRRSDAAEALATAIGGTATSIEDLCARADLIVTATSSRDILIARDWVRPGSRIVAVGADAPGKRELDPEILASATVIVDSVNQCIDHGETGWAVRAGLIDATMVREFGLMLDNPQDFAADETVVVDLTGIAIQDLAIAKAVWSAIRARAA
ncbi:ornithine cyclodeaminase family protein [Pelagerythrobacter aerophilus]